MILNQTTEALLQPYLDKKFHALDFDTYLRTFGASSHGLMDMKVSPKYYKWRRESIRKSTDTMNLGTLVHSIILEPHTLETRMKVKLKVDGRTKEGKAYNEDFMSSVQPSDIVIDSEQHATLLRIRDELQKHDYAKLILGKPSIKENAGFWIHDDTQVFCKIRPDIAVLEGDIIVDIKTTTDANPSLFQKQIYNYEYDMQAAFYIDGYRKITGRQAQFVWLCVENTEPHDIACYHATDKVYGFGKNRYEKAIRQFEKCFREDKWPGYASGILPMDLPAWAETAEQNLEDLTSFAEDLK